MEELDQDMAVDGFDGDAPKSLDDILADAAKKGELFSEKARVHLHGNSSNWLMAHSVVRILAKFQKKC